ncbi:MAG: amidohydrolase family protein [Candidatus Protistobacter heckmanni]|nr:amidohydrolase family protein [Candidatus Protistobacter heckmanni]
MKKWEGLGMSRRGFLGAALAGALAPGLSAGAAQGAEQESLPPRGEFLIRHAWVLTMDPAGGDFERGDIHVRDGLIVAVGPKLTAVGAELIDGEGMIAMPGFVDTHFHLWSCVLRASTESYFPLTLRLGPLFTPADAYRSARLGIAESLLSGVTTVHNWCHNVMSPAHADAEIRAMHGTGVRGRFSYGWGQDLAPEAAMDLADLARVKRQWFAHPGLLTLGAAMRTPVAYQRGNVGIDVLKKDWLEARALGLPITMHSRPGAVALLEKEELLGPDVLLVHPQGFTPEEIGALARRGVKLSSSPFGENRNGVNGPRGPVQFAELSEAGLVQSLSVDEVVTNGKVDFFAVMREVLRVYSQRPGEKKTIAPRRILEMATRGGAQALGLEDRIGSLAAGKRADIVLVRRTDLNLSPALGDPRPDAAALGRTWQCGHRLRRRPQAGAQRAPGRARRGRRGAGRRPDGARTQGPGPGSRREASRGLGAARGR